MRLPKPLGIILLISAGHLTCVAAEIAVLRNGFEIRHDRREQRGDLTRLYPIGMQGYVDIPTDSIVSFQPDDTPPSPPVSEAPKPALVPAQNPGPASANASPADLDQLVREASSRNRLDPR